VASDEHEKLAIFKGSMKYASNLPTSSQMYQILLDEFFKNKDKTLESRYMELVEELLKIEYM
jgi:hypothetical protein